MALAIAVLGWVVAFVVRRRIPEDVFGALSFFYVAFIPPLIGSLASAEERQLGTLVWQSLLPVAMWKQWVVKVGMVLSLALLLSLGLPALLLDIPLDSQYLQLAAPVAAVTIGSLYVSSLSTSGLWAFLISVAVTVGIMPMVLSMWVTNRANQYSPTYRAFLDFFGALALLLAGGFLLVMLALAFENHRSAERNARRVWLQVFALGGCLLFGIVVWLAAVSFHS